MRCIVGVALLMSAATAASAQGTRSIVVRGTVRDSAGKSLYPGRVYLPQHPSQSTFLREDGSYLISAVVPIGATTITVRGDAFFYLHVDALVPLDRDTLTRSFTLKRDPRPIDTVYTGPTDSAMEQRSRLRQEDRFRALSQRSGTYAFAICRPACTTTGADTLGAGRFALFASPLDSAILERALAGTDSAAKRAFLDAGRLMSIGMSANACYVFDRKPSNAPRSVATRHAGALASMDPRHGDARLYLYRWHDAWHFTPIRFDSNTFSGRGAAWTARQTEQVLEDDFIGARRIADADLGICAEAARATMR